MNLTDAIAAYEEAKKQKMPADILKLMTEVTEELIATGLAEQTVKQGDKVNSFSLPDQQGNQQNLGQLLENGPVVVSFYRGGWCPYCNLELKALQEKLPEITAAGANLVAVSPELPESVQDTKTANDLSFTVLSDVGNEVAKAFGLVFTLSEKLQPVYNKFGLDIPARNGDQSWELPFPATFVIQPDKTVSLAFVSADYTQRLEPQEIVDHLRK
ncbi:alkyl hydroperoxide reductase [Endozoicomonas sp. OPT23]|uniref:peroxiredoxin-like family protein n=1 Tax=Endozoicomonas sp. OPT23 TaxID=2072845 RepID=UPI00129BB5E2|nr:peroxiredoxin-like family protein [Endozoicomonas sp. OPT23]MRI31943.1 alkyl hydroperoxide reductase [Endozoicomonas sp. OPT23]